MQAIHNGAYVVLAEWETLANAFGAHAARVSMNGEVEVLIVNAEGEAEWQDVTSAELVQPAGKPAKARKQ